MFFSTIIINLNVSAEIIVAVFPLRCRGDLALMGRGACQEKM